MCTLTARDRVEEPMIAATIHTPPEADRRGEYVYRTRVDEDDDNDGGCGDGGGTFFLLARVHYAPLATNCCVAAK